MCKFYYLSIRTTISRSYWWNALGLLSYWVIKGMPVSKNVCLKYKNQSESFQFADGIRLNLEHFYVLAFTVLFIGFILALL